MNKTLIRFIALVLVACLAADPLSASGFISISSRNRQIQTIPLLFVQQALQVPDLAWKDMNGRQKILTLWGALRKVRPAVQDSWDPISEKIRRLTISYLDLQRMGVRRLTFGSQALIETAASWDFVLKLFIDESEELVFSEETISSYRIAGQKLRDLVPDFIFIELRHEPGIYALGATETACIMRKVQILDISTSIKAAIASHDLKPAKDRLRQAVHIIDRIIRRGAFPIDHKLQNFGQIKNGTYLLDPGHLVEEIDSKVVGRFLQVIQENSSYLVQLGSLELAHFYLNELEIKGLDKHHLAGTLEKIFGSEPPVAMADISEEVRQSLSFEQPPAAPPGSNGKPSGAGLASFLWLGNSSPETIARASTLGLIIMMVIAALYFHRNKEGKEGLISSFSFLVMIGLSVAATIHLGYPWEAAVVMVWSTAAFIFAAITFLSWKKDFPIEELPIQNLLALKGFWIIRLIDGAVCLMFIGYIWFGWPDLPQIWSWLWAHLPFVSGALIVPVIRRPRTSA